MAIDILRPHDCLIQRIGVPPPCRRRNFHYRGHGNNINGNGNANHSSSNSSSSNTFFSNPRFNRKPAAGGQRSSDHQRKRHQPESSSISNRSTSADDLRNQHHNIHHNPDHFHNLIMDKVTILRRGESLDSRVVAAGGETTSSSMLVVVSGTERIGSTPEVVPRQIRITDANPPPPPPGVPRKSDVYAGSAFVVSPAPSALPLPSFSKKKKKKQVSVDDSATRDLRRLLRLDL